jgi:hypothetical protein
VKAFHDFMYNSSEVAQGISDDSHGLIFGLNRFIALILQSSLTFIVTDESGFALEERSQFVVYGIYFGTLGIIFGIASYFAFRRHQQNRTPDNAPLDVAIINRHESQSFNNSQDEN